MRYITCLTLLLAATTLWQVSAGTSAISADERAHDIARDEIADSGLRATVSDHEDRLTDQEDRISTLQRRY